MSFKKGFTRTPKIWVSGFTLMELMIVIAIASILMTTVVVQQRKWDDNLSVSIQAFDLGMTIRQAQIYGLGAKEDNAGSEGDKFNVGYGVDVNLGNSGDNTRYIFFADRNNNKIYDAGEGIGNPTIFTKGVTISRICGIRSFNGTQRCSTGVGNNYPKQADVVFLRPAPGNTEIFMNGNGNILSGSNTLIPPYVIDVESANGKVSTITVNANGQVSISQ
jgi:prepilin-type N-terminal cleavage/methylation domain-containing protein